MVKKSIFFFVIFVLGTSHLIFSQEIKIFKVGDFDLHGAVKSCLVITDYGKEEYYFDETGKLAKSVTRYNESNYETTHYKYKDQELIERRVENYRDNVFDSGTSFASFYDIDTLGTKKITEKIVSYDKELMERNIYHYGQGERLTKIEHTDTEEIDEHLFTYSLQDGDSIVTHKLNGVLYKTKQIVKPSDGFPKTVIKQNFLEGEPVQKTVQTFDASNRLLSLAKYTMDSATQKWIPGPTSSYTYTEDGTLLSVKTETRTTSSIKEHIYQLDGTTANNWVKKIITPDNTYTTRRIKYYEVADKNQDSSNE